MSIIDGIPCPGLLQQQRVILKKARCPLRHLRKLLSISPSDSKVSTGFIIVIYIVWIVHWRLSRLWEQKLQRNQGEPSPRNWAHLWEHTSPNAPAQKLDKQSPISQRRVAKLACVTGALLFRHCATTASRKILLTQPGDHLLVLLQTPVEPSMFLIQLCVSWVAILLYTGRSISGEEAGGKCYLFSFREI